MLRSKCPDKPKGCLKTCEELDSPLIGSMETFDLKLQTAIQDGKVFVIAEESIPIRGKSYTSRKVKDIKLSPDPKKVSRGNLGFEIKLFPNDTRKDRVLVNFRSKIYKIVKGKYGFEQNVSLSNDPRTFDTYQSLLVGNLVCFPKGYRPISYFKNVFPGAPLPNNEELKKYELLLSVKTRKN